MLVLQVKGEKRYSYYFFWFRQTRTSPDFHGHAGRDGARTRDSCFANHSILLQRQTRMQSNFDSTVEWGGISPFSRTWYQLVIALESDVIDTITWKAPHEENPNELEQYLHHIQRLTRWYLNSKKWNASASIILSLKSRQIPLASEQQVILLPCIQSGFSYRS